LFPSRPPVFSASPPRSTLYVPPINAKNAGKRFVSNKPLLSALSLSRSLTAPLKVGAVNVRNSLDADRAGRASVDASAATGAIVANDGDVFDFDRAARAGVNTSAASDARFGINNSGHFSSPNVNLSKKMNANKKRRLPRRASFFSTSLIVVSNGLGD
jgi:hypothetical protein